MNMQYGRIFSALAFALLLGLAAQPASAQHHPGAPPPHYNPPNAQNHPRAAARAAARQANRNAYQAGRPANAYHPPSTYQPAPGANGQAANAAHAPNTYRPPLNGNAAQAASRPGQTPAENTLHSPGNSAPAAAHAQNGADPNSTKLPGQWTQKLGQMSPQQQDHFLQNNERFKSMPPEKQQQIRQNLQNYNRLSPTERMAMKDRQATWEKMSPEQRGYVQKTLLPKWQQMSPDRKQVVTDRLHTLQGMTPEDRQKSLSDPQFMRGLNPDEQSVLRGLDQVRNPSNP
jgi:hypothetical protein